MASQTSADLIANIAELEQLRQLATRPNVQAKMDELQREFRAELAEVKIQDNTLFYISLGGSKN